MESIRMNFTGKHEHKTFWQKFFLAKNLFGRYSSSEKIFFPFFKLEFYFYYQKDLEKQGDLRDCLVLLTVTQLWHVAQWVSRAPPHHILPVFLNLNATENDDKDPTL